MVSVNKFFTPVFLVVVYASLNDAAPWSTSSKAPTHRVRHIGRGVPIETFHPTSTYETFGAGIDSPGFRGPDSLVESAISFVQSRLGVDSSSIGYKAGYSADASQYAYVKQYHDGAPFANAVANVAFKDNKAVAFGSSFVNTSNIASSKPSIPVEQAIPKAEQALEGKFNDHPPTMEYLAKADGSVALTHIVQIQNDQAGTWYEAFVDAHSGELLSVTDFVAEASYIVLPITKETLLEGFETLVDPADPVSSPLGWHSVGTTNITFTAGNNVVAFKGSPKNITPQSDPDLTFHYIYDVTLDPPEGNNSHTARTNAFYIINTMHDLAYRYGFTESAFNFQTNNFGKGGQGNDRVLMSVQDPSGTNNANFATPPDGQPGICRMFIFTFTIPKRDGSLENDIPTHEMTHGITNRMTGGGTGRCLQTLEAGGMGEGWSDAMADWNEQTSDNIRDYVLGQYVINNPAGIRSHPYSTSSSTNPLRYSSLQTLNEVHNIGEVWANLLHNVHAALVAAHGFSTSARTNPTGKEGNIVFMHLFIDGLSLQPCNPTFLSGRDALIQADVNRYGGANRCLLWKIFASRGLGVKAADHNDDSTVPADC